MALLCAALAIPCRAAPLSEELAAQLGIENLNSEIPLQAKEFADDADLSGLSVGEILKLSPSSLWNGIAVQMGRILSVRPRTAFLNFWRWCFSVRFFRSFHPEAESRCHLV